MNLRKKELKFSTLCGDWHYRNIDMTEPHLSEINIENNKIIAIYEKYSSALDDYIFCNSEIINNSELIKKFKTLNLGEKSLVLDFISDIDCVVDWNKIVDDLNKQEIYNEEDDYQDDLLIVPAKKLGDGWNWHKYDDGSGYLEGPDGSRYMDYDLSTNEYKIRPDSRWEFFPLSYYYLDGIEPSQFKTFDFMEQEMIDNVLTKENKNEEMSL